jgi:predicted alpha/beta-hydrolase family hydrolase
VIAPELLEDGPPGAACTVVLAHGAGAPMDSPFMEAFAKGLSARGHRVLRFEFPYMAARRSGGRRPPDREEILLGTWRTVIAALRPTRLVIGGKSMGGRMASRVADAEQVAGLLCLGYPFHPPGKPDRLRIDHLSALSTPGLIVQGTRDPFGRPEEVSTYPLPPSIRMVWITDGDHDLRPRKSSGRTVSQNWEEAVDAAATFVAALKR